MRVASTAVLILGVTVAVCYGASTVLACWYADKLARLCRRLGRDPMQYSSFSLPPGPEFWEYMRVESRRSGRADFRALSDRAEVALVVRMVSILAFFACVGLEVLLRHLMG